MMDEGGRGFELSAGEKLFVKKYYSAERGNDPFSTTDVNAVIFPWNFKEEEEHGSGERKAKGKIQKKVVVLFFRKNACPSLRRTSSTRGSFRSSYVSGMLLGKIFL